MSKIHQNTSLDWALSKMLTGPQILYDESEKIIKNMKFEIARYTIS